MRRIWAQLLAVAALLCSGSDAGWAGEAAQGAILARKAHAESDTQALRRVARSRHGDVWIVVEQLLADDGAEVAEAVVAAGAADPSRLAAYIAWRKTHPVRKGAPETLDRIEGLRRQGDQKGAQTALAASDLGMRGVSGVRLGTLQAFLLPDSKRALAACVDAAEEAKSIGYRRGEQSALGTCVELSYRTKQHAETLTHGAALLTLLGETGDRTTRYYVHRRMASAAFALGRRAAAIQYARRVLELSQGVTQRRDALRQLLVLDVENPALDEVRERHLTLRRLEAQLGNRHGVAATDSQLARVETQLGRWSSALERIERALAFFEAHGKPFERRGAHANAAFVALGMLDGERALRHVAAARTAGEGLGLNEQFLLAAEAAAYALRENYQASESAYRALLAHASKMTPRTQAGTWLNLATVQTLAGHYEEAAASLTAARAATERDGARDLRARLLATVSFHQLGLARFDEALRTAAEAREIAGTLLLTRLESVIETRAAEGYIGKGNWPRALEHANRAVELILQRSAALPERVGAHYRAELRNTFALAIDAAVLGGNMAALFAHAERARAVALRTRLGGPDAALDLLEPEVRERELRLRGQEAQAVRQYRAAQRAGEKRDAQRAVVDLSLIREQLDRHRERMHAGNAAAAQLVDPKVDRLTDTQARLAPTEAQIHYARGREGLLALVVTRKAVRLIPMGSTTALDTLLSATVLEDPTSPFEKDWAQLKTRIVDPLALAEEITRVTVIPTGRLEVVPFAALLPGRDVTLAPSATVSRLLSARGTQAGRGILAIGDAADAEGERLPGASREALRVGDKRLVGKQATEKALRVALGERERWRAVHFAGHALIDARHPMRTSLALAPEEADDGFWRVSEILGARVPADLVVLAACSSAQGRAFEQEGRLGFVHAFFVAGAERVLASLWDIDDRAAEVFMARFYDALGNGNAPATALRRTQAWMRTQRAWRHPAHWAGWQLWGPHDR